MGGYSQAGSSDGQLNFPSSITYVSATGNIYVVDYNNSRVSAYSASTGAFVGWIGGVNTAPTGGCTTANNASGNTVSTGGWCTGGTSASKGSCGSPDKGGGFAFGEYRSGITTDGTYLYIANSSNNRIDKWTAAGGVFQGATNSREDNFSSTWTTNTTTLGTTWANCQVHVLRGIYTDGTSLYGLSRDAWYTSWGNSVFKMNLSTGTMIGWKGAILPNNNGPTAGDPGCSNATGVTPGWCQNGHAGQGVNLGGFYQAYQVTADPGATGFIYVSDPSAGRVTRLPK